jgi:hypothetical protein
MSVQPGTPSETAHSLERVRDALERRYRVERELGSGRTGTVYLAYDRRRGRKVAVRVLSPSLAADPEKREAFVRAAKAARFSDPSPYMVRIRTVGHAAGIVYATLDYVDGETLGEWLRREGPLTVSTATRLLYHVARGVGCAHGAGVIIGGLTPDDVILERTTGRPVVTNVGIARAVAESAYSAARAPFMSPEQVQGAAGDERSDVYALGVTAYFAVTGYLPFEGHTPGEVYMGYVIHGPPRFGLYNKNGNDTFRGAVRRCLETDPAQRFEDAFELSYDIWRAPEISGPSLPWDLHWFVDRLTLEVEWIGTSPLLMAGVLLVMVILAAAAEWAVVTLFGLFLAWQWETSLRVVLAATRSALAAGYSCMDMVSALREKAASERRGASANRRIAPLASPRRRRATYAVVGLLGVVVALPFTGTWPPDGGWLAIALGLVAALSVGGSAIDEVRDSPHRIADFWLAVWQGRVGAWIVRLAGWRLGTPPVELAAVRHSEMRRGPSFDDLRRYEATRDLVNLAPAKQHRVVSRVNAIRACLNPEAFAADPRPATPPFDWGMRARLELCLERLQFVRYRLGRVQLGDSRRRLAWEYDAAERACEVADALLEAAGAPSSSGPQSGRCCDNHGQGRGSAVCR